jgi:2-polyprenyl-3-methyl-5-hydroxy-6-metoxy-1,4-benzoquinol methylase
MNRLPGEEVRRTLSENARMRFEARYESRPPWDIDGPQPAFVKLWHEGLIRGPVLDVGCGTGENALFLAAQGIEAWGIDLVLAAIGQARAKARARGLPAARFLVADALALRELGMTFETVIDSGLFHALSDPERPYFEKSLEQVIKPGGLYHMLCFSDREPGTDGPRRVSQAEILATFARGWRLLCLEDTRFLDRIHEGGARAWLASLERVGAG